jgi:hypothetical protein
MSVLRNSRVIFFFHMENRKQKAADAGDVELESLEYRKPQDHIVSTEKLNQRII